MRSWLLCILLSRTVYACMLVLIHEMPHDVCMPSFPSLWDVLFYYPWDFYILFYGKSWTVKVPMFMLWLKLWCKVQRGPLGPRVMLSWHLLWWFLLLLCGWWHPLSFLWWDDAFLLFFMTLICIVVFPFTHWVFTYTQSHCFIMVTGDRSS